MEAGGPVGEGFAVGAEEAEVAVGLASDSVAAFVKEPVVAGALCRPPGYADRGRVGGVFAGFSGSTVGIIRAV